MNKKLSALLAVVLALQATAIPVFANSIENLEHIAVKKNYNEITAKTMIVSYSHKSLVEIYEQNSAYLQSIKLKGESIEVVGSINSPVEERTFFLTGSLYNSVNSKNLIIGNLIDKHNNYDVLYFGMALNPEEVLIMDATKKGKSISTGYLTSIYLQDKASKEIYFIELDSSQFIKKVLLLDLANRLKKCDYKDHFWYAKVLVPSETNTLTLNEVTEVIPINAKAVSNNQTIAVMAATYRDITYQYIYNITGARIVESITVRHYIDGPSSISGQGSFVAKLLMVSEKTTCATVPSMNTSDSNMEIGVYQDTKIDAVTSPGDYLQQVVWGGRFTQSGSLDIACGWGYTLPLVNLGVAASYSKSSIYSSNTYKSFDNGISGKYVRQAGIKWTKAKERLTSAGQNFDTSFTVNKLSTPGSKKFTAKFTYDVSNGLDYMYGGTKNITVSKSYTSN